MLNTKDLVKFPEGGNIEDSAIEEALNQTLVTFRGLLNQQREKFMQAYPQFVNERTKPKATVETIVRPDGSVVVIEKQESRRLLQMRLDGAALLVSGQTNGSFSRRTRTREGGAEEWSATRAVLVYGGPRLGYELRLELDNDERPSATRGRNNDSADSDDGGSCSLPLPASCEQRARVEKAWLAAQELVATERRYVAKLELLENVGPT